MSPPPSDSRSGTPGDKPPEASNKRRRVALACSNCRHRKSRCDGRRPKCSLCSDLGCECQYEQAGTALTLTVGKSFISQLEQRLQDMESKIKELQQGSIKATLGSAMQEHQSFLPPPRCLIEEDGGISAEHPHYVYENTAEIGELDTAEDSIDGMGAMKFADEEDCGYFGPSSNIAFLRHISFAIARGNAPGHGEMSPSSRRLMGAVSISRPHHAPEKVNHKASNMKHPSVNMYALPSEDRTWALIREYFQKTGQLLPFIHEESFCDTYFQMKQNNFTMARRTWLGLLNIILAMATTLSVEAYGSAKRIEESEVYYQRANALCDKEFKRNVSLELVQYLLVLGQYLQGMQKSVQAWTVHGLAITTALQLGLHSPRTNSGFSPLESETRKRVWYGCILLDRTLSMTFGRPSMIPDKYMKLELPLSEIHMVGPNLHSEPTPHMDAMFFSATIKLYNVMYHVIDTCYGQNLGLEDVMEDSELLSLVLEGERLLEAQRSQIQRDLRLRIYESPLQSRDLEVMESQNLIVERFNIVISLRYHNIRILLHRPILERILDTYASSTSSNTYGKHILQQIGIRNIEACVESAKIIVSAVHTVVLSSGWRKDLLGAWNYSLFYRKLHHRY
ncbi:hypothetical protein M433DRAFT_278084 [Acidomyces richmondensis BFW]|nr:MAG: hypothetical protein FE78DRAFT_431434 [Acidomyces sp. 'richmondensis']KYG44964.1 hypothetical protein M433DRAFT_278084 [Acidomyces richmondensis BFW]